MGPLQLLNHLLNFLAPAMGVGLLVATAAPVFMKKRLVARIWAWHAALNSIAGAAALGVGLWLFGNDGKMASYALLVVLVASSQWACGKGWKA